MMVTRRFLRITVVFVRMFLDFTKEYRLIKTVGFREAQRRMAARHERRARRLYDTAVDLGGVMIKLCQFFSARRDIFPEPYIRILSDLQDSVPPVPFADIETVLVEEFGDYRARFPKIAEKPVASASLGQVHRARLAGGDEVVVKVLKPGIETIIDLDFAILHYVFRILQSFGPLAERADFGELLDEFIRVTGDELNFRREVHLAGEFRRHMKRFDFVRVPLFIHDLCTDRVITMEHLSGDKISDVSLWSRRSNDPVLIARRLVEIYMEQFLFSSLIHYDPHPGNLLISDNNTIILLDFGMAGYIPLKTRDLIRDALEAFIRRDGRALIDILEDLGFIRRGASKYALLPVVDFFVNEVAGVMRFDRESLHDLDLSPVIDDLVEIIYRQPITMPAEWAYIGKTAGTLSGIIAMLNPDFNIVDELRPYAERLIRENRAHIVRRTVNGIRSGLGTLLGLPSRISEFIDGFEAGHYKFKVDYREIYDKIDEVKIFTIRVISLLLCSISAVGCYIFYYLRMAGISYLFCAIAVIALMMALLYRPRTMREKLQRYL